MSVPSYSAQRIAPESQPETEQEQQGVVAAEPAAVPRKRTMRKWLGLAFRMVCTILLFVFLLKSVSWSSLLQNMGRLDDGVLLVAFFMGLAGVVISAYQWQVLLDAERIRIDLRKLVNLYLVGIAFNHFLPTGMGGDVVKAYYVGQDGKNPAGSASAAVMSRVTGYVGMLLVSVPALLIWHENFNRSLTVTYLLSSGAMCLAIGGVVAFVALLPKILKAEWMRWRVFSSASKIGNAILVSIRRPRAITGSTLYGVLFHISAALNYYAYGMALHLHVPFTFYLVAIPFVALVAFLPISINGFGLRESALVFMFSTMHVPASTALLLALLADAQNILFGVIGGCIYLAMGRQRIKKEQATPLAPAEVKVFV